MNRPERPSGCDSAPSFERSAPGDDARLFVALWPEPDLRAQLIRRRDAWRWPPAAKPVPDDRLHLTLHFIGAVARTKVGALHSLMEEVAVESMTLQARAEEVWPGGIAVLRFAADAPLTALHRRLGAALADVGVALNPRPYSPHVTLARRARGAERPRDAPPAIEWRAGAFTLVESLRGAGAGYRVLQSYRSERAPASLPQLDLR